MNPIESAYHQSAETPEQKTAQSLFQQIQDNKHALKEKKARLLEILEDNNSFVEAVDKIKLLKVELKGYRDSVLSRADNAVIQEDIEGLQTEIKNDTSILCDLWLNCYRKDQQLPLFDSVAGIPFMAEAKLSFKRK